MMPINDEDEGVAKSDTYLGTGDIQRLDAGLA
jgi:hypothetical protein